MEVTYPLETSTKSIPIEGKIILLANGTFLLAGDENATDDEQALTNAEE